MRAFFAIAFVVALVAGTTVGDGSYGDLQSAESRPRKRRTTQMRAALKALKLKMKSGEMSSAIVSSHDNEDNEEQEHRSLHLGWKQEVLQWFARGFSKGYRKREKTFAAVVASEQIADLGSIGPFGIELNCTRWYARVNAFLMNPTNSPITMAYDVEDLDIGATDFDSDGVEELQPGDIAKFELADDDNDVNNEIDDGGIVTSLGDYLHYNGEGFILGEDDDGYGDFGIDDEACIFVGEITYSRIRIKVYD